MEDRKVKKQEPVLIEYTQDVKGKGGQAFIKKGKRSTVHSVQAEKLVASGRAKIVGAEKEGGKK